MGYHAARHTTPLVVVHTHAYNAPAAPPAIGTHTTHVSSAIIAAVPCPDAKHSTARHSSPHSLHCAVGFRSLQTARAWHTGLDSAAGQRSATACICATGLAVYCCRLSQEAYFKELETREEKMVLGSRRTERVRMCLRRSAAAESFGTHASGARDITS